MGGSRSSALGLRALSREPGSRLVDVQGHMQRSVAGNGIAGVMGVSLESANGPSDPLSLSDPETLDACQHSGVSPFQGSKPWLDCTAIDAWHAMVARGPGQDDQAPPIAYRHVE